jgi:hypothetical protein
MSKPHISDARQRRSKRYAAIHAQLRLETQPQPEPDKLSRKRSAAISYRQHGAP